MYGITKNNDIFESKEQNTMLEYKWSVDGVLQLRRRLEWKVSDKIRGKTDGTQTILLSPSDDTGWRIYFYNKIIRFLSIETIFHGRNST